LLLKIKKTISPPDDEDEQNRKKLVSGGNVPASNVGNSASNYEKPTEKEGFA